MYTSLQLLRAAKFYLDYNNLASGMIECSRLVLEMQDAVIKLATDRGFKLYQKVND